MSTTRSFTTSGGRSPPTHLCSRPVRLERKAEATDEGRASAYHHRAGTCGWRTVGWTRSFRYCRQGLRRRRGSQPCRRSPTMSQR